MKNFIKTLMLLIFFGCLFCSFLIVKSKVKTDEPSFIINKTKDLSTKEVVKTIKNYNSSYNYYYKYSINRTYHSKDLSIYTTEDTLSKELKKEDN